MKHYDLLFGCGARCSHGPSIKEVSILLRFQRNNFSVANTGTLPQIRSAVEVIYQQEIERKDQELNEESIYHVNESYLSQIRLILSIQKSSRGLQLLQRGFPDSTKTQTMAAYPCIL